MAAFDTTTNYRALTGLRVNLPSPTSIRPEATTYLARDTGELFWLSLSGGVATWVPIVGGAGPGVGGALPKYFVNVAGQQPAAPYTSVQAAVNAAVADGHDTANPTTVVVYAGTYVEDL